MVSRENGGGTGISNNFEEFDLLVMHDKSLINYIKKVPIYCRCQILTLVVMVCLEPEMSIESSL
jgi:hypothetical protein